jgi:hypothetical protein
LDSCQTLNHDSLTCASLYASACRWVYAPWALALALTHVRLSRWAPDECTALVLELGAWAAQGGLPHDKTAALRMQVRLV